MGRDAMHVVQLVGWLAGLIATLSISSAFGEPLRIRNSFVPVASWAPMLEAKKDLAKHWGK
jgi:hypothetical protein